MRRAFRLRFRTQAAGYGVMAYGRPPLDEQALLAVLEKALIREWRADGWQVHAIELELSASSNQDAIEQLKAAMRSFGLIMIEVVITDLVAAAIQRAVAGAFVFGLVGATTRNPWVTGLSSLGGAVAGAAAEDAMAMW
jgi:hypothetical protein